MDVINTLLASDYYMLSLPALFVALYLAASMGRRLLAILLERLQ